ncbi:MAG: MaoC family dehydratase N-terminal domain-containing protein [Deltaproteobacteria bacterium]|nr:MaoC family dehydratase N-terminal domain-containing protein [Deltaproteobacteria bacterium]
MPLNASTVGTSAEPVVHDIDERWLMSYAAGLGETLPCYLDTVRPGNVIAHPLFPVCFEWPAVVGMRTSAGASGLTHDEAIRSVHATHDLVIHRGPRPGDRLTTRATIVGVERRKPGAFQVMRLDTVDAAGLPVCTTWQGGLFRDVAVVGEDRFATDAPPAPRPVEVATMRADIPVSISALAAHVYTECARIWNPVHTDIAVAKRAGLPDLILHGTATLALAVSCIVEREADNRPERVRRIAGRFSAMVLMPSEITVRLLSRERTPDGDVVRFEARNADGKLAVQNGLVGLRA